MSLNKLTDVQKGVDIKLKVGCVELKVNELQFDGVDGKEGDVLQTDGGGVLTLAPITKDATHGIIRNTNTTTGPFNVPAGGGNMLITTDTTVADEVSLPATLYTLTATGLQILQAGRYRVDVYAKVIVNSALKVFISGQLSINGADVFTQKAAKSSVYFDGSIANDGFEQCLTEYVDAAANDTISFGLLNKDAAPLSVNPDAWYLAISRVA